VSLTFAGLPFYDGIPDDAHAVILGIPYEHGASGITGQAQATTTIRDAGTWEDGIDELRRYNIYDLGDYAYGTRKLRKAIQSAPLSVVMGGDDSINICVVEALARIHGGLQIVSLDAHLDVFDPQQELNHASWLREAKERYLTKESPVYVAGVREIGTTKANLKWCRCNGVTSVGDDLTVLNGISRKRPTLLAIDIDSIDPSFAPGVAYPEPFGFTSREVLSFVRSFLVSHNIVGLSITEVTPHRDINDTTAKLANRIILHSLMIWATVAM